MLKKLINTFILLKKEEQPIYKANKLNRVQKARLDIFKQNIKKDTIKF